MRCCIGGIVAALDGRRAAALRLLGARRRRLAARLAARRRACRAAMPRDRPAGALLSIARAASSSASGCCSSGKSLVRGAGVPFVLLPPPSAIGARIADSMPILCGRFPPDLPQGGARRLCHRLRRRLSSSPSSSTASPFLQARPAADRQSRLGAADHRHRADHGDVVRLRLAVEGRRRRRHDLLPDAGEHGRRARRLRRRWSAT